MNAQPIPADGRYHQYCWNCLAEHTTSSVVQDGRQYYACSACGQTHPRSLIIDPTIVWWTDADSNYWHEVSGVFVRDPAGRFLFFERAKYPFGLTVPAGHRDVHAGRSEDPAHTASRELREETGLSSDRLVHIASDNIVGDECRRGANAHHWHAYLMLAPAGLQPRIRGEGSQPVWLTLDQALAAGRLTFAMSYLIARHRAALPG